MPPQLALGLTILSVAGVLWLDRRWHPVSGTWIPQIWMLIISSRPVAYWFHDAPSGFALSADKAEAVESELSRNIWLALIVLGAIVLIRRRIDWAEVFRKNTMFLAVLFYMGMSILWSEYKGATLRGWVKHAAMFEMGLILATTPKPSEAVEAVIRRTGYILLPFSITLIKYFPEYGREYGFWGGSMMICGVCTNKNGLGRLCLFTGLFFFYRLIEKNAGTPSAWERRLTMAFAALATLLLLACSSTTSLLCLLVGLMALVLLQSPMFRPRLASIFVSGLVCGVIINLVFGLYGALLRFLGKSETLTGRTDLWSDLLSMQEHPILGFGYRSFWVQKRMDILWETYHYAPNQAHNGYLEVFLELGIIGLILTLMFLAYTWVKSKRDLDSGRATGALGLALLSVAALYNVSEAALTGMNSILFLVIILSIGYKDDTGAAVNETR